LGVVAEQCSRQSSATTRIEDALRQANGNRSRAAQRLGMTLRQLSYRIQRLSID